MRLINTRTLELVERSVDIPRYAILSHTWGEDEVSFSDWDNLGKAQKKEGFRKIELACQQAVVDNLDYAWVDTNCINKTSSSELSEAINSMFAWYRDADVCYVFLEDVKVPESLWKKLPDPRNPPKDEEYLNDPLVKEAFKNSKWFERGWTLQELLAPSKINFYSYEWLPLGTKESNRYLISRVTGIDFDYLTQLNRIYTAPVARRMSWAARRKTTRIEDTAYCLLGIFGIHMALLYGEGHRAFLRLQEEIIRVSNDQTLFCWQVNTAGFLSTQAVPHLHEEKTLYGHGSAGGNTASRADEHRRSELEQWTSILAPHPSVFQKSAAYRIGGQKSNIDDADTMDAASSLSSSSAVSLGPYSITNFGLSIALPLLYTPNGACAVLDAYLKSSEMPEQRVVIVLHRLENGHYVRMSPRLIVTEIPAPLLRIRKQLFIDCRNTPVSNSALLINQRNIRWFNNLDMVGDHPVVFLTFSRPVELGDFALASAGMDYLSFQSIVEVDDNRRTRCAVILKMKSPSPNPVYFLVAGRSVPPDSRPNRYALAAYRGGIGGVSMDWLVDVLHEDSGDGSRPIAWRPSMLQSFLDKIPDHHFGSWCKTADIENVLSWRVSSRGALFLHIDINKLPSRAPTRPQAVPRKENLERFCHLRKLHLPLNELPMERIYESFMQHRRAAMADAADEEELDSDVERE